MLVFLEIYDWSSNVESMDLILIIFQQYLHLSCQYFTWAKNVLNFIKIGREWKIFWSKCFMEDPEQMKGEELL